MPHEHPPVSRSPRGTRNNQQDNVRAGMVRVVLSLAMAGLLPLYVPATRAYVLLLVLYPVSAILFQVAIVKDWGGAYRVLLGGLVDMAFLTFIVHRAGTSTTPLVMGYPFIGTFNALAVPAWAAVTLGGLAVAGYAAVAFAEALHFLPYAPDSPRFGALVPDVESAALSVAIVMAFMAVSTLFSLRIARALQSREDDLRRANLRLEELSQQDPLTLLYNRRHFVRRAQEELARVRRGHEMVLLMMDLDGFKQVNDTFGHITGDEVLKSIATALQASVRNVDVVARFGGDEFVVMLTDTDPREATVVAGRLITKIREAAARVAPSRPVTASVGIAAAQPDQDVTILLNLADDAAYRAKQAGGNRFSVVPPRDIDSDEAVASGLRASNAG